MVEKSGAWFSYNSQRLGQGRENAKTFLQQNPDTANEIELALRQNAGLIAGIKAGRYLALDCEMVATAMDTSRLARVSIVNYHLQPVYDSFVLPDVKVSTGDEL